MSVLFGRRVTQAVYNDYRGIFLTWFVFLYRFLTDQELKKALFLNNLSLSYSTYVTEDICLPLDHLVIEWQKIKGEKKTQLPFAGGVYKGIFIVLSNI